VKSPAILAFAILAALGVALGAAEQTAAETPPGAPGSAAPFRFAFSYAKGDKFRILSTVNESVIVNRRLVDTTQILNRISYEVADAAADGGWGLLRGTFETSERASGSPAFVVTASYDSEFKRDRLGRYEISPEYYMPVVRNDPTFPDRELRPGDTWAAPAEERHDLRPLGIPDAYSLPIDVHYKFIGPARRDGTDVLALSASYTIFLRPPEPRAHAGLFPVQIAGYSDQRIYWDPKVGDAIAYEEKFDLVFDWSDGSTREWRGTASSKQLSAERMDRATMKAEVEKAVSDLPDVSVAATEGGVTISLENVQFEADSARLKPAELGKVARVAEVLKRYPDRDILVAGHSARAGYAAGRKQLSEERAKAVAEQLIALGARPSDRVRAVGYGDERPAASNDTEEGRARNRRVEITILEN